MKTKTQDKRMNKILHKIHLFCCLIFVQYFVHAFVLYLIDISLDNTEVVADKKLLTKAIQNIIGNAVSYSPIALGSTSVFAATANKALAAAPVVAQTTSTSLLERMSEYQNVGIAQDDYANL